MESGEDWEKKLQEMGMPEELPTETEKARREGIELVSTDLISPEASELSARLKEEDPSNLLGGFPNTTDLLVSVIGDTRKEWLERGVKEADVIITIHASCVNGRDCVILSQVGGNKFHYNTKDIRGYSRQELVARLIKHGLFFREK